MKLTVEQVKLFNDTAMERQKKLWLQRYKIFTKSEAMNAVAKAYVSEPDQVAILAINEDLSMDDVEASIKRSALHECLEILMHEITHTLEKHHSDDVIDTMIHRVIRTMEYILSWDNE